MRGDIEMNEEIKIQIVNEDGVLRELNAHEHKIVSLAQIESFKKKLEQEKNRDTTRYVISVNQSVREVIKHMSLVECGAMFSIMIHLQFKSDGLLVKDGSPITMGDLEKILGKGRTQTVKLVNSLEKLSLLFKEKQGKSTVIRINEVFHFIGKGDKKGTTKVYKERAKSLIEKLTLQELGVLYKIMPYFHWEHMVLCSNPDQMNTDYLGVLSLEELADLVNVDRRTLERIMPKLVSKNAVMKAQNGNRTSYIVNPRLFFRMNTDTELTRTIRAIFDSEEKDNKI